MRRLVLLLLLAAPVAAQGIGRTANVHDLVSQHNKKRLRLAWDMLPPHAPVKQLDGSTKPARAPWPFALLVTGRESKAKERLFQNVWDDLRFVIALQAVRPIEIKPEQVIKLPYLASVRGVRDPTVIVVDRDFGVVGAIHRPKEFEFKFVMPLVLQAAKREYKTDLSRYIGRFRRLVQAEEKLWKQEREVEALQTKMVEARDKGDLPKARKLDEQADRLARETEDARLDLEDREIELRATLRLKATKGEPLPETVGTRPLTRAEKEALETFRAFARNRDPVVRAAAVEDLGTIDSAAMVAAILKAANDPDMRVIDAAGLALGRMDSPASLDAIRAALGASRTKVRIAALLGLAQRGKATPGSVEGIVALLRTGGAEERRAAIKALEQQAGAPATPALIAALDDRESGLRIMAAQALGNLRARDAAPALAARLTHADWALRRAVARALGRVRVKESIPILLARFAGEQGLLREVIHDALVAITGQDFGYDVGNWQRWWDKHDATFRVPTRKELQAARVKAENALKGYARPDKRRYHTIETLSRRIVFVIDVSSSMRNKITSGAGTESRVKMDIAKRELTRVLAGLDEHAYFNIIAFAGKVKPWQQALVRGTRRNEAIKYVASLEPVAPQSASGRSGKLAADSTRQKTNTYGALVAALGLADEAVPAWRTGRSPADTIFLVTDGLPTTGKIVDAKKLVAVILDVNRTRGAVIHVILFDKDAERKLRPLADGTGGQCVVR
ncbi:MAG: HEAT repeat domain-containing protein [Planctomycetota bacterium]|jgi:HEAT repeat protein